MFDGNPAELDSFDNAIRQWCIKTGMPLYHGGVVVRDPESEYEYVNRDDSKGVSNYVLGKRLIAAISSKFENTALKWWEDYDSDPANPYPNCWRKNGELQRPPSDVVPAGLVEVSSRDLLKKQFSADINAREAELELECFMWKPFDHKESMNVMVVREHIERLMKTAGKTGSFQWVRCIRNCLPQKFKDKVEMAETEEKLWKKIIRAYVTVEVDQVDKKEVCSGCGKTGHTLEVCRKAAAKGVTANPSNPSNLANPSEKPPLCPICKRGRHKAKNCYSVVGRPGEAKANTPTTTVNPAQLATIVASQTGEERELRQATLTEFVSQQKSCYQCGCYERSGYHLRRR
ncbi:hypothetical protein EV426DRAFT_359937 [Tirmania nivea]|nr:hypothetical protein EV426DRAFT_359937 [Tirmania nivea]